mmetsp:Transcript_19439/g.52298  ORF Transcript_19439/g.52298 Transcript_19439/m.52298 type:complete len:341 (-) Transcript_19439:2581-3603(-)
MWEDAGLGARPRGSVGARHAGMAFSRCATARGCSKGHTSLSRPSPLAASMPPRDTAGPRMESTSSARVTRCPSTAKTCAEGHATRRRAMSFLLPSAGVHARGSTPLLPSDSKTTLPTAEPSSLTTRDAQPVTTMCVARVHWSTSLGARRAHPSTDSRASTQTSTPPTRKGHASPCASWASDTMGSIPSMARTTASGSVVGGQTHMTRGVAAPDPTRAPVRMRWRASRSWRCRRRGFHSSVALSHAGAGMPGPAPAAEVPSPRAALGGAAPGAPRTIQCASACETARSAEATSGAPLPGRPATRCTCTGSSGAGSARAASASPARSARSRARSSRAGKAGG